MVWPILIGGAIVLASTKGLVKIDPLKYSIKDPLADILDYKKQLYAKIVSPAVAREITSWTKSRILKQVDVQIPSEHRALVKAVIQHESAFNPTALAGYKKGQQTSFGKGSTAFGVMQVLRSTFESVNKGQLQFRHEDLWYPPFAISAGYETLKVKLKKAKGDMRDGLAFYAGKTKDKTGYNYKYADEVMKLVEQYS